MSLALQENSPHPLRPDNCPTNILTTRIKDTLTYLDACTKDVNQAKCVDTHPSADTIAAASRLKQIMPLTEENKHTGRSPLCDLLREAVVTFSDSFCEYNEDDLKRLRGFDARWTPRLGDQPDSAWQDVATIIGHLDSVNGHDIKIQYSFSSAHRAITELSGQHYERFD